MKPIKLLSILIIPYLFIPAISNNLETIHGYTLPPEPDLIANNATLGGVDSNDNGVRDDVERAIYKKYNKKLYVVILMDRTKFYQRTLVEPTKNAKIIQKDATKIIDCRLHLSSSDKNLKYSNFKIHINYIEDLIFNNKERILKYYNYNKALSGGVYGSSISDWNIKSCSSEIVKVLEEMKKWKKLFRKINSGICNLIRQ